MGLFSVVIFAISTRGAKAEECVVGGVHSARAPLFLCVVSFPDAWPLMDTGTEGEVLETRPPA